MSKRHKEPLPFKRFRYGNSIYIVKGWKSANELLIEKEIVCAKIPLNLKSRSFGIKFPITDNLGFTIFKILQ